MMSDSAPSPAAGPKPQKNRDFDADGTYLTPAERQLAERAAAALQWAQVRRREGEGSFRVSRLAGRYGWAYRTAMAAVEHLERTGAVRCVAARGRDFWALT